MGFHLLVESLFLPHTLRSFQPVHTPFGLHPHYQPLHVAKTSSKLPIVKYTSLTTYIKKVKYQIFTLYIRNNLYFCIVSDIIN